VTGPPPTGRVIVVGSVNIDLVVVTDRLPKPGETVTDGRFARHHGGKGGNQAVAAARLGGRVAFIGAVGDDPFGDEAREALADEGIDIGGLLTLPGESTGVALILVDAAGENLISVAGGANAAITRGQVEAALAASAVTERDVLLVGHEIPTGVAAAALAAGRAAGATTILNPAPAAGLGPETLDLADVITPNEGELEVILAASRPSHATMLVSLGAAGARLETGAATVLIPAPAVDAVDTVGAGDTLNGALAVGLADNLDLEYAARRAVVAASLAVRRAGAREGMPTLAELRAFVSG
jgi:ribokinase